MASLSDGPNGTRILQFADPLVDKRRTLRLGRMTKKQGLGFKAKIESILFCKASGTSPDPSVAEWLAGLDRQIADKLVEWNLVNARATSTSPALLDFVDGYIKSRKDVKPQTTTNYLQARRFIAEYFPQGKRLADVHELDAEQFRAWMVGNGCAENYVRTQCKNVKMFFRAAVKGRLIPENPFQGIKTGSIQIPDKLRFISSADVRKILKVLPDIEWRVLVVLSRWGGLRIPSEIHDLRWEHVNWEADRITIMVPKLARFAGKDRRVIPMFPELREILQEAFEQAKDGAIYVLPRLRATGNLRTSFNKFVERAGLVPWIKPFMNLRSTRETELTELFPLKTVSEWMGHDAKVSLSHYQQVLEEHWERAAAKATPDPKPRAAKSAAVPSRNAK
jgi:integrase